MGRSSSPNELRLIIESNPIVDNGFNEPLSNSPILSHTGWFIALPIMSIQFYGHLLVITGCRWDYTIYVHGVLLVLITGITRAITVK